MSETKRIAPHEGFQEKFVRSNVDVVIGGGQLAGGKAQPLDSLVCTPFGFRKMGDLKVGDIITNSKGGMQKVVHIYERGLLQTVEFEFSDGRKTKCALDHLWKVRKVANTPKRAQIHGEKDLLWEIMTTEQIIALMDKDKKVNVPICEPIQFTRGNRTQGVTIHPYLLGCLLGDGCLAKYQSSPKLFTADKEMIEKIVKLGYDVTRNESCDITYVIHDRDLVKHLKQKKLWGCLSDTKFVPNVYKYSTIEDRIELLQGLFDTDGSPKSGTQIEYDTVSEKLAKDVQWIVRSLGGYCSISQKVGSYRNEKGEKVLCKKVYRLYININIAQKLFNLKRKVDKLDGVHRNGSCTELGIVSYKKLKPEDMRCIRVSCPDSLYITDDFIVTHNTFGAILSCAEPSLDPRFRAVFLRNNLGDLKSGGGVLDSFRDCFGSSCKIVESGDPHVDFPSGASIDVTHIADQTRQKLEQRFKGRQYDMIYFDELTGFSWECFTFLFSRNRGQAAWTGKVRATTNPKRSHWLRIFLDWYIGVDGEIIEEREGVVRYFYISGEDVKSVVWGDTKEEVYNKCKIQIDRFLYKFNGKTGKATYKDVIKSFTFYLGRTSENKSLGENYASSVAAMGGKKAEENSGNWNVDTDADDDGAIPQFMANQVFVNDPCVNNDRWVTCDLADTGTDNFLALAWDGLHIIDILILGRTTPKENAERLEMFAASHDVANSHIIYDAIRGTYINDWIPDAIPYVSYRAPMGLYGRMAQRLKDECYLRFVECVKRGEISISDRVATKVYEHQKLRENITVQNEFLEECAVVRFVDMPSGKKRLATKKEMNQRLGRGRSMDLLDPCAMRMLPLLDLPYGEELERTYVDDYDESDNKYGTSVFDESIWC